MKLAGKWLLVLLFIALALTWAPAGSPLPPSPHQYMSVAGACAGCHAYYRGNPDPHEFVVTIPEKCWECHSQKNLGRSHPIGVDPRRTTTSVEVPEEFPLEAGNVSCGSCHNPHMEFLAKTKAYPAQSVTFIQMEGRQEISWYKTLFLRKSDPIQGFEPLCTACHRDF